MDSLLIIGRSRNCNTSNGWVNSHNNDTELRARREALTAQRSSGVARVSYDAKTVVYRSVAEIDRAFEALDREIAAVEGRRIVRKSA